MEDEEEEEDTDDESVERIVTFSSYIVGRKGNIKSTERRTDNFQFSIRTFDTKKIILHEYKTGRMCTFNMPQVIKLTKFFELGNNLVLAMVDMNDILYVAMVRFSSSTFQPGPRKEIEIRNQTSPIYSIEVRIHHPSRSLIILLGHYCFFVTTFVATVCQNSIQGLREVSIPSRIPLQQLDSISSFHMMFNFGNIMSQPDYSKKAEEEILKRHLSPVMRLEFLAPVPSQPGPIFVLACQLWPNLILLCNLFILPPSTPPPPPTSTSFGKSVPTLSSSTTNSPSSSFNSFNSSSTLQNTSTLTLDSLEVIPLKFLSKCFSMNIVQFQRRPSNSNSGVINLIVCSGLEGIEILIPSSHRVMEQSKHCRRIFIDKGQSPMNTLRPVQKTILVQCLNSRSFLEYVLIFATDDVGVSWGYQLQWDDIVSGNDDIKMYTQQQQQHGYNDDEQQQQQQQKKKKKKKKKRRRRLIFEDLKKKQNNTPQWDMDDNNNNDRKKTKKRQLKKLKREVAKKRIAGMMFVDRKQTVMYIDENNHELFSS